MGGFITERNLDAADEEFPGIKALWDSLPATARPRTFLDLVTLWMASSDAKESN